MIAKVLMAVLVAFAGSMARAESQPQLPFEHPDEVLVKAWLGQPNVRLIDANETVPAAVVKTLSDIDVPFEMGDGYYDAKVNAIYEVTNPSNPKEIVGYMDATILSYTEDPEYYLAIIYVNPKGRLVNPDWVTEASPYSKEEIEQDLPPELQLPSEVED